MLSRWGHILRRCGECFGKAARAAMCRINAECLGDCLGNGPARARLTLGSLGHGAILSTGIVIRGVAPELSAEVTSTLQHPVWNSPRTKPNDDEHDPSDDE